MAGVIRPNQNQRSGTIPVDDEVEAVIVTPYVLDPASEEFVPASGSAFLDSFEVNHFDTGSSLQYLGLERADGHWVIQKLNTSTNPTVIQYAQGESDYDTAWAGRGSQTYVNYGGLF